MEDTTFEQALLTLIGKWHAKADRDEMISAMELQIMALKEDTDED